MSLSPHTSSASARAETSERYREAMEFILGRLNYERVPHDSYTVEDFRLARMEQLLAELGNPQSRLPAVHIAGTKGKGSTAVMLAAMLQAAGLKTGLFTSPHLEAYEERIMVNGLRIEPVDIVRYVERLRPAVERVNQEFPESGLTFFELTTALAWLHFAEAGTDIVVLEAGLGGRLDSTNVCNPVCCIITSISRDHMRLLGETLPAIATEKAGIIKKGVRVISGVEDAAARGVITATAKKNGSMIYELDREISLSPDKLISNGLPYFKVDVTTPWARHERLSSPLPGRHQLRNLALATAAFDLLSNEWRPFDQAAIAEGLGHVHWPLRIEQIGERPRVVLDAAHNDASVQVLCETLKSLSHPRRVLVFGTSRDKDHRAMLEILLPAFDEIVLTRYTKNPRALPVDQLLETADLIMPRRCQTAADPESAWRLASSIANENDLICITGSLFLAAEMRSIVTGAMP